MIWISGAPAVGNHSGKPGHGSDGRGLAPTDRGYEKPEQRLKTFKEFTKPLSAEGAPGSQPDQTML